MEAFCFILPFLHQVGYNQSWKAECNTSSILYVMHKGIYFWLVWYFFSSIIIQYLCLFMFDSNVGLVFSCLILSHRCIICFRSGCPLCGTLLDVIHKAAAISENPPGKLPLVRLKWIVNDLCVVLHLERMMPNPYT